MAKHTIDHIVNSDIKYSLEGTLGSAIAYLNELADRHGTDALLDIGEEQEPYDDRYRAYVRVFVRRLETDEEESAREASAAIIKGRMEAYERKQLAELQAKYGKKEE